MDIEIGVQRMPDSRRQFIKKSISYTAYTAAMATGLFNPKLSYANWLAEDFARNTLDETMNRLFGDLKIKTSKAIKIKLPRIAENGAVVPIKVTSSIENVDTIIILVEKNPVPLSALFSLSPAVEPYVSARIKMAETCDVIVVLRAEGELFSSRQKVKVTIGGCGG